MPKISIIVTFKNGEKYLRGCINNILEQTYKDYELILIDDDSNDKSKEIIEEYENQSKIRYYFINDKTIGVGKARNYGIEKAQGKYIMFVDVDDYIDKTLLENMNQHIEKNIEIIKYKMNIIDNCGIKKSNGPIFSVTSGEEAFNKLCFQDKYFDSPCLYVMKKELFNNLKFEENVYHEDFGLIPKIIISAKTVVSTNFYGYNYIQTHESIMRDENYSKKIKKVEDKFYHYINMINNLDKLDIKENTKKNLKIYYTNSVILSIKDLEKEDRKKYEGKIKKLHMIKNIKVNNFRQLIKKMIMIFDIDLYLRLKV